MEYQWVFLILLLVVSFLYSSVGHGGASGYLALMALWGGFSPEEMKTTALVLNLFVAAISFILYAKSGYFNFRLFIYFAISSVPFSFLGGTVEIDPSVYKKLLGVLLIFSVLRMLNIFGKESEEAKQVDWRLALTIGAVVGLFSGMIGIGGGIILSPLILILHWGKMKETAAVSALFIWVNSAAGLLGQTLSGITLDFSNMTFVVLAVAGAFLGGFLGAKKFDNKILKGFLAVVLGIASIKLILT